MQQLSAVPDTLRSKRAPSLSRRFKDNLMIALFLAPAAVLFLILVIYPIFRSIYFSLFNWNGMGPAVNFVGLQNFTAILTDKVFIKAMVDVLLLIVLSLCLQLPLSLAMAVLVGRSLPGRGVFRVIFFLPYVLSEVNVAIMWMLLYNADPERGFLNALLVQLGAKPVAWLGDVNIVLLAVFFALTWKYFGFHMLLFLTGLQNIPAELDEAASIDGANSFQRFFSVTLPLLGSTIRTSVQLSVLGSIQTFGLIWIMTKGGPVNASETLSTYMYRFGFVRFQLGYGSAVALYMFLFCLAFTLIYRRLTRQPDYLSGM